MELKEEFQQALDFEEKGQQIYREAAKKSKNPIVMKTFDYLADQEQNHIREIKDYLKKEKIEFKGEGKKGVQNFFSITVNEFKEKTKLSKDDIKAHETALELERNAYDFYKKLHGNVKDGTLKKFFSFLMEQENAHYEFVQKTYDFIKNPEAFYSEEEGWMVDGG
ncbi:MAG: ferritin family protein [Nanoarchaeota archaeon]